MLRIRFEFRKGRSAATTHGTVYAVIYLEGQEPAIQTTGIRCEPDEWRNRATPRRSQAAKELNEKIVLWERSLMSAARTLSDRGDAVTADTLISEKNYITTPLLTLAQVYALFSKHKENLIGRDDATKRRPDQISRDTFRTYATRWSWVEKYLKSKRTPSLLAIKVDAPFVESYHAWLSMQDGIGAAYATKCVKLLTEVCQWAFRAGHIRELRTGGFRGTGVAESAPFNVSEEDVIRIEQLDLSGEHARIRDGWLLARELCLHYSDYMSLRPHHFFADKRGRMVFEKFRVKQESGRRIKIAALVSERAQRIWESYGETVPAFYSNVHMGRIVAYIGEQLELPRRLTFSHARDSGIFRLVAAGKKDIEIKLAAGWTTTRQLSKYVNHDRQLVDHFEL